MEKDIYMIIEKNENGNSFIVKWLKETDVSGWFKVIGQLEVNDSEELKALIPNKAQLRLLIKTGLVNLNW